MRDTEETTGGGMEPPGARGGRMPRQAGPPGEPPAPLPVEPAGMPLPVEAAVAPPVEVVPPRPEAEPPAGGTAGAPFLSWLRTPRPDAAPGVWTFGHRPRPPEEPDRIPGRQLLSSAVISLLCGWLLWSLLWNGYLGHYWIWPLFALTPDSWREEGMLAVWVVYGYYVLVALVLVVVFGRLGRWPQVWRRWAVPALRRLWDD
ncbi:ATP-binding protein, partial [Streptomyces sp. UNOB3_S3]|nr:ATP-binding protein [Streptomyces sp. UNOB3_S3]